MQPGVLLVFGVLQAAGYTVNLWRLVLFTLPIVGLSILLGVVQFRLFGRSLRSRSGGAAA